MELFGLILTLNRLSVGKKLFYRGEEVFRGTPEGLGDERSCEVGGGRVVQTMKLARPNGEYQCPAKECTNVFHRGDSHGRSNSWETEIASETPVQAALVRAMRQSYRTTAGMLLEEIRETSLRSNPQPGF